MAIGASLKRHKNDNFAIDQTTTGRASPAWVRSRCLGAGPPRRVACVAWRFCRAGRRGGVSTKNSRAKRARTSGEAARKIKLLPLQSPRGFSALARLYHLVRPTKPAMLRRLLAELKIFQVIGVYETKGIHK